MAAPSPEIQHRDDYRCRRCRGWCCRIYGVYLESGTRDHDQCFEAWAEGFHPHAETYGVEPLFDPLLVHGGWPEARAAAERAGLNVEYCEYHHPSRGCLIPRERRPVQCRTWRCPEWEAQTDAEVIPLSSVQPFRGREAPYHSSGVLPRPGYVWQVLQSDRDPFLAAYALRRWPGEARAVLSDLAVASSERRRRLVELIERERDPERFIAAYEDEIERRWAARRPPGRRQLEPVAAGH